MDRFIRKYQGVEISKKEEEFIRFIETGKNSFWDAFYNYEARKKRFDRPTLSIKSWFNGVLKRLHSKDLMKEIPFVLGNEKTNFIWANPGINASKANFEYITIQDTFQENRSDFNKIL